MIKSAGIPIEVGVPTGGVPDDDRVILQDLTDRFPVDQAGPARARRDRRAGPARESLPLKTSWQLDISLVITRRVVRQRSSDHATGRRPRQMRPLRLSVRLTRIGLICVRDDQARHRRRMQGRTSSRSATAAAGSVGRSFRIGTCLRSELMNSAMAPPSGSRDAAQDRPGRPRTDGMTANVQDGSRKSPTTIGDRILRVAVGLAVTSRAVGAATGPAGRLVHCQRPERR